MTTDASALRVVAVGNHRKGYGGLVQITVRGADPVYAEWPCGHLHGQTAEARDCARRMIAGALGPANQPGPAGV